MIWEVLLVGSFWFWVVIFAEAIWLLAAVKHENGVSLRRTYQSIANNTFAGITDDIAPAAKKKKLDDWN